VYNIWKDKPDKYIININSRAKYPNISKGYMYSASKAALSQLSNSLRFKEDKKCRITDINPGLLESDLPSMTYDELAKWIVYLINAAVDIEIGEISLWHRTSYVDVQNQKQIKLNESRKNMGKD
jgi:NAD(P)-dependent dehydrogenase (short-subunit alcohol dehydrogenase family)